ncbi:MAG: transketolase [Lachnoclostridium sp.]|jgi:transketolase|nr:transketolase [Lachnoclostridium sp.]
MNDRAKRKEQLVKLAGDYRNSIIDMIYWAKAGHPGGSLSAIDIMAYLYETDIDLSSKERSRFVMSKGHAVPALYAILYKKGIIKHEELKTFRKINSRLQGHSHVTDIPETDVSTGLLGQGLSVGVGMALGKKLKKSDKNVYVMAGDGELHEGQMWEGIMEAPYYALENLYLIIDHNKLSSKAELPKVMDIEPLADKIKSFRWHVEEINGHDFDEISDCFDRCKQISNKPKCIIAHTVKGKGVSYMENVPKWHSSALTDEEYQTAKNDLRGETNE